MIKNIFLSALLSVPAMAVAEGGSLFIENVKGDPGYTVTLPVMLDMTASDGYDGQFDLTLPEGLSFDAESQYFGAVMGEAFSGYSLNTKLISEAEGTVRFMFYNSTVQEALPSGETELMTITVNVSDTFATESTGYLTEIRISHPDSEAGDGIFTDYVFDPSEFTATPFVFVRGLSLEPVDNPFYTGDRLTLKAVFTPENATEKTLTWTCDDIAVATVSDDGTVTGIKAGECVISAMTTDGTDIEAEITLTLLQHAEEINLDMEEKTGVEGGFFTLTATVLPDDTTDKSVAWASSDTSVATVDAEGKVSLISVGTAVITATTEDGTDLSASCDVTVEPLLYPATSIALDKTAMTVTEGDTFTLTATVLPENASDKSVTWTSTDDAVATVDANGKVTTITPGTASIIATTNDGTNLAASCTVTVEARIYKATSITLDFTEKTGVEGGSFTLTATVLPDNTTDKGVAWTSSDAAVATVDANGKVSLLKAGYAVITATTEDGTDLSASCEVTVEPLLYPATSIALDRTAMTVTEGDTFTLTATVLPENASDKSVTWTSSDTAVATVDSDGNVTTLTPGTASIIASTNDGTNLAASCSVTVEARIYKATSIVLDFTEKTGVEGGSFILTATILPDSTTDKSVAWNSSDATVATVDANGKVSLLKSGDATITATTQDGTNLSASCKVTVEQSSHPVTAIYISDKSKTVMEGDSFTLTATVLPANASDGSVTWISSDTAVATVDTKGNVYAVAPGTATITATTNDGTNLGASCSVTVKERMILVTSISLNHSIIEAYVGDLIQMEATLSPANSTDMRVEWKSENPDVASVSSTGRVSMVGAGETTVTATTCDGSNLTVSCRIICKNIETSVSDVSESKLYDIYTLGGTLIHRQVGKSCIELLKKGVYILVNGDSRVKIVR